MDSRVEMFQMSRPSEAFFNMKALAPRPISNSTEFDTDFEDDESEIEDNSPRLSVNSVSASLYCTISLRSRYNHRAEKGVKPHYHLLKRYTHRVQIKNFAASIST